MRLSAAAACLALAALPAAGQGDFRFEESPACRVNEIPLGQPARIEAVRGPGELEVRIAANFGCGTKAGRARIEERAGELHLFADTLLPDHPTPACKCTRHLTYRLPAKGGEARRIVFVKDGRVEGEGRLEPQ